MATLGLPFSVSPVHRLQTQSPSLCHTSSSNSLSYCLEQCTYLSFPKASDVGFVYGSATSNKPNAVDIVNHCRQNNISKLWLSKAEFDVLDELPNSQIKVIIPAENTRLKSFAIDPSQAISWVKNYIFDYWPSIEFQYICVGQEALQTDSDSLLPAMKNIYDAIQQDPIAKDKIKVSTSIGIADLEDYNPTMPPSECKFKSNITTSLTPILKFLSDNKIPLFINVFPYQDYVRRIINVFPDQDYGTSPNNLDVSHYLFTATTELVFDPKGDYVYKYVFDSMVDGFYAAIDSLGVRDVKLIVAATGWPRNGGNGASLSNAQTYNNHLIGHVKKGTPKWPRRLETYIHSMYDEDRKTTNAWEPYYGVFNQTTGNPLYNFNLLS